MLPHDSVVDIQPAVLPLDRTVGFDGVAEPVVTAPPRLELFGAQGVSDVFNGVAKAVGVVVGWVDAPCVPCPVVVGVFDPVGYQVWPLHNPFHMSLD